jgi:hypothetical protein
MQMTLIYPNIVPENNLRLPDALTIKHGPARLLAKFVIEGDKAARQMGLRLRLRHDFDELVHLNKEEIARGNWFRLVNMFNPEYSDVSPENAFWVSGEDQDGEIAVTWAGRVYYWPDTNLAEQARAMFYGRDDAQPCDVTAPAAELITGVVLSAGSVWVRPEFRGKQLSRLFPRIGRAYACSRWPIDWTISYVAPILVEKGVAAGYGQKNFSHSIFYPRSPWGDLEVVVAYTPATEIYEDLASFMGTELSATELPGSGDAKRDAALFSTSLDNVTNTSSVGVLHGNSSRS